MQPLSVAFQSAVSCEETLFSPPFSDVPGVRIAVDQVHVEDTLVRFRLLVTHGLPNDYASSFRDLDAALVLVVREAPSGRGAALRLISPYTPSLLEPESNFVDRRRTPPSRVFASGRANATFEVPRGPGVSGWFVHVALHAFQSNVVEISATPGSAA